MTDQEYAENLMAELEDAGYEVPRRDIFAAILTQAFRVVRAGERGDCVKALELGGMREAADLLRSRRE